MTRSTRTRLVEAAFELFAEQGYEHTSVDDIAARAGTGRTTFFRYFPSKEDVVFPDHDALLPQVEARLATATASTYVLAMKEAARIVLDYYVSEGDAARSRYRLTRSVCALRDRELATVHRYLRVFSRHAITWMGSEPDGALRGELLASGVITAHNHVLRSWLRGDTQVVGTDFDMALDRVLDRGADGAGGRTVIIDAGDRDVERIIAEVRKALTGS